MIKHTPQNNAILIITVLTLIASSWIMLAHRNSNKNDCGDKTTNFVSISATDKLIFNSEQPLLTSVTLPISGTIHYNDCDGTVYELIINEQ